ncbi:MAG: addiction module antidote protein, HigA family [Planctomycetes bacterium GWF2_39_10]|nr:MAG: addiction module antidote protein, HigA family [Planctomycetes bacterium GWA2_39_15]OHB40166.1 MAG: addiction module antidote protein, HigA family [Planctomycetes bacterium GWC2_39_26]OHB48469.1 MAG: addiction module antidote protein, HigA family [Planctomycetes bacterium GWF2_39_10]OHC00160.1 MAG: addiction module antidote protein, HigA family [Planctomycetes bacterium RIFCSPLOWO2_12_FULL_39_13]
MVDLMRKPTHPGEILEKDFLEPLGITQSQLAKELNTTFRTINQIVNERRNISPEMAVKLSRFFGTSEELWLSLQNQYDLYTVKERKQDIIKGIRPLKHVELVHRK